jgi:hypothetical protein
MRSRDGQNQQRSAHQERFQAESQGYLWVSATAEALLDLPAQREHAFPLQGFELRRSWLLCFSGAIKEQPQRSIRHIIAALPQQAAAALVQTSLPALTLG